MHCTLACATLCLEFISSVHGKWLQPRYAMFWTRDKTTMKNWIKHVNPSEVTVKIMKRKRKIQFLDCRSDDGSSRIMMKIRYKILHNAKYAISCLGIIWKNAENFRYQLLEDSTEFYVRRMISNHIGFERLFLILLDHTRTWHVEMRHFILILSRKRVPDRAVQLTNRNPLTDQSCQ